MNVYRVMTGSYGDNVISALYVLANNVPHAIEVADQHLIEGHDPTKPITLVCEDVKSDLTPAAKQ